MDTPKEDGGATSPAERHVVVPVEPLSIARTAILEIQRATIEGRVCDDVAWFSTIETLHDFCASAIDQIDQASARAALSAAPPVQMEAVAWFIHDPDAMFMTTNKATVETHEKIGIRVTPLYASPVPSPAQMEAVAPRLLEISSAPKDGTHILGLTQWGWREVWYERDYYEGEYWADEGDSEPEPTHWAPLPGASPIPSSVQMEAVAWRPIETAPRGRKVIVSVPNGKNHKPITMMGRYWPHGTLEVAEGYEGEDWAVEVNGEFYMPEGWYEECEVDDAPAHNIEPTHWMPLPAAPGASPVPSSERDDDIDALQREVSGLSDENERLRAERSDIIEMCKALEDAPLEQLRDFQTQLDPHGEFVGVSRQALDEVLSVVFPIRDRLSLKSQPAQEAPSSDLEAMVARAVAAYNALSPEQKAAHDEAQRKSFLRSFMAEELTKTVPAQEAE